MKNLRTLNSPTEVWVDGPAAVFSVFIEGHSLFSRPERGKFIFDNGK
jgi:hypothetical protein